MANLILPRRFAKQPQTAAPIDYAGLGRDMRILWNPAAGPVDLVTGRVWTPGGDVTTRASSNGQVFSFDGVDDYFAYTGYPELTGNVGTFFLWATFVGIPDTHGHVFFGASTPNVCGSQIYPDLRVSIGSNTPSSGNLSSWFGTANRSVVFASGGAAATTKCYLDGIDSLLAWIDAPKAWGAGDKNFNLGRYVGGSLWDFSGSILVAGFTDAVWGTAEARAFHENPWQLFKTSGISTRKIWIGVVTLAGESATQSNTASTGAVVSTHSLATDPAIQINVAAEGAVVSTHNLAAAPVTQTGTTDTGAVVVTHLLATDTAMQGNTASTAAIAVPHDLAADPVSQANAASSGAVSQAAALVFPPTIQDNVAASSAVVQTHLLAATACLQRGAAGTGAIRLPGIEHAPLGSGPRVRASRATRPGASSCSRPGASSRSRPRQI